MRVRDKRALVRLRRRRQPLDWGPLPVQVRRCLRRVFGEPLSPLEAVRRIVADVRERGEDALREYSRLLDGVDVDSLEVSEAEAKAASRQVENEVAAALFLAAQRVRDYHQRCLDEGAKDFFDRHQGLGRVLKPLARVGIYIPGGTASYPSTVLMTAIPARVAGVRDIVITTPPRRDGSVAPAVLVAARLAGVSRVFRAGGAQAIAALAFGTDSIPRVDKICGPGNIFVQLAKREVFGYVDIDGIYGPTETVVIADDSADPARCAAELLAQAEHDPLAQPILLTPSRELAEAVAAEVERQLAGLERREIARAALERRGGIFLVGGLDEAVRLANQFAPEHLSLMVADPGALVEKVSNAGAVFIGGGEAFGDYIAGPSHCLPTGGTARFFSPLRVEDFLKETSLVALDKKSRRNLAGAAITLARSEGLTAHARALEIELGRER